MKNPKWTLIVTTYLLIVLINPDCANGFIVPSRSPSSFHKQHATTTTTTTTKATMKDQNDIPLNQPTRRQMMIQTSTILLTSSTLTQNANAVSEDLSAKLNTQSSKFKRVPLFSIVNGETGTPFMILQNTGKAQAYFFTTYEGAQLVLTDAIRDAAEQNYETKQMWKDAKISAVNLEFGLKLSSGKPKAKAQNSQKYDTVYDVIPSLQALNEAEKIDTSNLYSERGRVPMFYARDFTIGPEVEGGLNRWPMFLEKGDLIREYAKKFPDKEDFEVTVVDLMDSFATMMGNKPIGAKVDDNVVNNLYIVPSLESRKKAVECEKERGSTPAYKLGEMIAVGGK